MPKSQSRTSRRADESWQRLAQSFPKWPALKRETLIAVPTDLLNRIKSEAPKFFSAQEWEFERELSAKGHTGFFQKRGFDHPLLNAPMENSPPIKRSKAPGILSNRALAGSRQSSESAARIRRDLHSRRLGYAGWLVTQPAFHIGLETFINPWRRRWYQYIDSRKIAEALFEDEMRQDPHPSEAFTLRYTTCCLKFSLEALIAAQLPLPHDTEFAMTSLNERSMLPMAGVVLFIPWHLVRDDTLALREIASEHAKKQSPRVVHQWASKKSTFGPIRHGVMFYLYAYLELALKQRYPERITGNIAALDTAFGGFVRGALSDTDESLKSAETARKIRQEMQRRLMACASKLEQFKKQRNENLTLEELAALRQVSHSQRKVCRKPSRPRNT